MFLSRPFQISSSASVSRMTEHCETFEAHLRTSGLRSLSQTHSEMGCGSAMQTKLKFVDLFAGLGGFHVALTRLGHECVFAAEIDPDLRDLYFQNFELRPAADVRFCWKDVPPHDILCAGFPCQPFSKAGNQRGFLCPDSGDLFDYLLKVVDRHRPAYLLFENVPNILRHNQGQTWQRIRESLGERGYDVACTEISPHEIGVPQIRNRAIIVAALADLSDFNWPERVALDAPLHIGAVLDRQPVEATALTDQYVRYLEAWEEFLDRTKHVDSLPSFPIWAMEFGADYPLEPRSPRRLDPRYLARFKGAFGQSLAKLTEAERIATLPTYVAAELNPLPQWKIRFIQQNRKFFDDNKDRLIDWLPKVQNFPTSFQKLEWNWKGGKRTLWDKVIQFRASGIRVKNPSAAPSLVALTTSQVPVIAWERRYMTTTECARLQSLDTLPNLPATKTAAFKALGNAVNADVIELVATSLLQIKIRATSVADRTDGPFQNQFHAIQERSRAKRN